MIQKCIIQREMAKKIRRFSAVAAVSQLLQTTNTLIARPLYGSPNCAYY